MNWWRFYCSDHGRMQRGRGFWLNSLVDETAVYHVWRQEGGLRKSFTWTLSIVFFAIITIGNFSLGQNGKNVDF